MATKKQATETGTFLREFPYVRLGNGPQNLVILPGITLDNKPPNRFAAWTYRLGFGRFAKNRTVYVIIRRRGMPPRYTTQEMAADYGRLTEISTPSLIIGGSEDPFYSEDLFRETAEKIPDATLRVYEGVGHGVPKERKRRYENDALAFLDERLGGLSGGLGRRVSPRAKEMG